MHPPQATTVTAGVLLHLEGRRTHPVEVMAETVTEEEEEQQEEEPTTAAGDNLSLRHTSLSREADRCGLGSQRSTTRHFRRSTFLVICEYAVYAIVLSRR
jgi:hypothetical protein